jgi:hypothetical protein
MHYLSEFIEHSPELTILSRKASYQSILTNLNHMPISQIKLQFNNGKNLKDTKVCGSNTFPFKKIQRRKSHRKIRR